MLSLPVKIPSAAYLDHVNSLGYHTASSLHGELLTAAIEMHHDCCYVGHYGLLSYENCVGWNAAPDGRFSFGSCLFGHAMFTCVLYDALRHLARDLCVGLLVRLHTDEN